MGKKQKHPEHENLERWLVSYADFMTLLFATFVVLYALSQVDIKDFKSLEDSIKQAFAAPSIIQGSQGIMADSGDSVLNSDSGADSMITPLMMEYMSQKYEDQSFQDIQQDVKAMEKTGELSGVQTLESDKGLIIRFSNDSMFKSGSAALLPSAKEKLDKIGAVIAKRFILHYMRIEGHTDNQPIVSVVYPSNWELSSARAGTIIRYFIGRFSFMPSLFTSVGFADTRPIEKNTSITGRAKNRRVDILILRNKSKGQENPQNEIMKMSKKDQEAMQKNRMDTVNKVQSLSDAAKKLAKGNKQAEQDAIILNQAYEKEVKRLTKETDALDTASKAKVTGQNEWLKPPAAKKGGTKPNLKNEVDKEFGGIHK